MATAAEIAAALRAELAGARNALAIEIAANLVEATPVDTGHARAAWVPGVGTPPTAEIVGVDTGARDAGIAAVLASKDPVEPVFVANNAPYIDRLIAGSSSQAPAGWDVVAIDEAQATVQAQYDDLQIDVSRGGVAEATVVIRPREVP